MRLSARRSALWIFLASLALTLFISCARTGPTEASEKTAAPIATETPQQASANLPGEGFVAGRLAASADFSLTATESDALLSEPPRLASLSISPSSLLLRAGEPARLTVSGLDQYGEPLPGVQVTWNASPGAGSFDAGGLFVPSTVAGRYPEGVTATVSSGGVTQQVTVPLEVVAGPLAQAALVHDPATVFTGDTMHIALEAADRFGNPVEVTDLQWEATEGDIVNGKDGASYRAGRSPGLQTVVATVKGADGASATARMAVLVEEGSCETVPERATWHTEWHASDPASGQLAGLLAEEVSNAPPGSDWGGGALAAERSDHVYMVSQTQFVTQRDGPVRITVSGDDGYRVKIDDEEVPGLRKWDAHGYGVRSIEVALAPGVYDLQLEYFEWDGDASLHFEMDAGAQEWQRLTGCTGGYSRLPGSASWVSGEPAAALAERFGVPVDSLSTASLGGTDAVLMPQRYPPRKVIVLQGLTTGSSCAAYQNVTATDTAMEGFGQVAKTAGGWLWATGQFPLRTEKVLDAIDAAGTALLDAADIIQFSYSGVYQDCGDNSSFVDTATHPGAGVAAVYSPEDTCVGVVPAAQQLKALIARLTELEPGVQVDLVGHSMGGVVAAYFMSQEPEMARSLVRSVIALDSPLQGFPFVPLCGGMGPAVEDILGRTGVVPAIRSLEGTDLAARVTSIAATDIGSPVPGNARIEVGCAKSKQAWRNLGETILGSIGAAIGGYLGGAHDTWKSHNCVWSDGETLGLVAQAVTGQPLS